MDIKCDVFEDKICENTDEKRCLICHLSMEHNSIYSIIVNDTIGFYEKDIDGGLLRGLKIKNNINKDRNFVEASIQEIYVLKNMISDIRNMSVEEVKILLDN